MSDVIVVDDAGEELHVGDRVSIIPELPGGVILSISDPDGELRDGVMVAYNPRVAVHFDDDESPAGVPTEEFGTFRHYEGDVFHCEDVTKLCDE